jgi:predicted peroxiredoxin
MSKTLGILVNTDKHFHYLYRLAKAAYKKNIKTQIFFTGPGVLLTQKAEFNGLAGFAKLSVCDVSFRANGLSGDVPGVGFKDFVTQAVNAEMAANCDRYIVL